MKPPCCLNRTSQLPVCVPQACQQRQVFRLGLDRGWPVQFGVSQHPLSPDRTVADNLRQGCGRHPWAQTYHDQIPSPLPLISPTTPSSWPHPSLLICQRTWTQLGLWHGVNGKAMQILSIQHHGLPEKNSTHSAIYNWFLLAEFLSSWSTAGEENNIASSSCACCVLCDWILRCVVVVRTCSCSQLYSIIDSALIVHVYFCHTKKRSDFLSFCVHAGDWIFVVVQVVLTWSRLGILPRNTSSISWHPQTETSRVKEINDWDWVVFSSLPPSLTRRHTHRPPCPQTIQTWHQLKSTRYIVALSLEVKKQNSAERAPSPGTCTTSC